jgi:hypothetical protein
MNSHCFKSGNVSFYVHGSERRLWLSPNSPNDMKVLKTIRITTNQSRKFEIQGENSPDRPGPYPHLLLSG